MTKTTNLINIQKETARDGLFKDAIYFFQLSGTPQEQEQDFAYLEHVIGMKSRVVAILSDKATYAHYMNLYGAAKSDRVNPYPNIESMLNDLHFRLKDY